MTIEERNEKIALLIKELLELNAISDDEGDPADCPIQWDALSETS